MHQDLIQAIVDEASDRLTGRYLGKIFQLSQFSLAFDFGLRGAFLFISVDPSSPRFYLIERRTKELERESEPLSHFAQLLRARIGGGELSAIRKDENDRIVRLSFQVEDEFGERQPRRLVAQLTGKAANLLLLDQQDQIFGVLRAPRGKGQFPGERYQPPPQSGRESAEVFNWVGSPSAVADLYFQKVDADRRFSNRAGQVRAALQGAISRKEKLKVNLQEDLLSHGEPDLHKRLGDLLLANIGTARRTGRTVMLHDYYSEGAPTFEIEIDEDRSLKDEAARQFRQYTKAKRAREEIAQRLKEVQLELSTLEKRSLKLREIIEKNDEVALSTYLEEPKTNKKLASKNENKIPGVRRYLSSDGYEVLVGRTSRDNDNLSFRIARPNDLWLHTGDYPGSHVVVRNPTRKEIPQRTLIEAAQLAGYFSQAREDSKVVVHYTERKFLSKPKGAAPGLVQLSRFRSISVEPKESIARVV